MALSTATATAQQLSLLEELILMLLNEENGYFHQVPGWELNCAVIGAAIAELSLMGRIDTDVDSLFLVDKTETGNPGLDSILQEIAAQPVRRNAQYWIERLAPHAESIIDSTLDRLVELKILQYHEGEFWTLARTAWQTEVFNSSRDGTAAQFVKTRIGKAIFDNEIPDPRDIIIICLINTCDVFRFIFQLDDEAEERIKFVCKLDVIGRSMAEAVSHSLAGPLLRRSALTKKIPTVSLRKLLFNRHVRDGNLHALFADLGKEYGPVFQIRPPFKKPMTFLAGPEANRWVHRRGRRYLRAKDYFSDFEKVYGASGVRRPALAGRRRPLPAPQGPVGGILPRPAWRADGPALLSRPQSHVHLDGWQGLRRHAHVPPIDQLAALAALRRCGLTGHHRRPDEVQGAGAHCAHHQDDAQVHAEHAEDAEAGEGRRHVASANPGRSYARPAG